ncbi:MAG: radical SAM protein [Candidatus Heimdallarchaeota archaeon]|nr:radical SAM protein [Candidatus Heimdallarchaeota archaeon]
MSFKTFVLELTQQCNNKCLYCYNPWRAPESNYPSGELKTKEIKEVIDKLQLETDVKSIALSGGEPFLRPDIGEIVTYIRQKGIFPVIITNGTLLTKENVQATHDAASYEITLLSYKKNVHNYLAQNDVFDRVIDGIINVAENKGNFIAAFVATKLNSPDLHKTIELAIALGAVGIMYNRVNLSANTIGYADQLLPTISMIEENLETLETMSEDYDIPIASSVPIPPCLIDTRKYKKIKFSVCPRGGYDSYYTIDSSGKFKMCNHTPIILGDFKTEKFEDLIKHPYVQKVKDTVPKECVNCDEELRQICFGGCRAASEACYSSLEIVDPIVKLAKNNLKAR